MAHVAEAFPEERIVSALRRQFLSNFGRGFGKQNLFRMIRFAEVFPDFKIVSALRTQLGWTHFRQIIALDDPLKRDFYAEMCRLDRSADVHVRFLCSPPIMGGTALVKAPKGNNRLE